MEVCARAHQDVAEHFPKKTTFHTKSQYAASVLRQALASGSYVAGQRLLATELARDLGLSVTPVREAFKELASDGLLEIAPHRGARVADIALTDLSEVYAVRTILEGAAARLAARRIDGDGLDRLAAIQSRFVDEAAKRNPDVARLNELNQEFHFVIYGVSGLPLLQHFIRIAWDFSPEDTFGVLPLKEAIEDHAEIVDALISRNEELAAKLMSAHIAAASERLLRFKAAPRTKRRP